MVGLRRSAGSAALVKNLGDGQVATKMRRFFYDEGLRQFLGRGSKTAGGRAVAQHSHPVSRERY